jgi:hypothetical protein
MDYKKSYKCKEKKSKNQPQDQSTRKKSLSEPPFDITCTAHAYSRTHHHPTHLHPEYASAVTLPRISSESVKKMALAQRKKAF